MSTDSTQPSTTSPASGGATSGAIFINPYATVSVKAHVPLTLELKNPNFTRWSAYFRDMCGKFGLLRHLDGPFPVAGQPVDPAWAEADCCVRSWIYGSVAEAVLDMTMDGTTQTARALWTAIVALFQANKAPRAIFLSHEFHSLTQGDSTINDYCHRMKTAADKLRDVDQPVSESTLVFNLLRGLNKEFSTTADHIAATNLSFSYARDQLLLKELRLANEIKVAAATALLAGSAPSCGASGCRSSSSSSGGQQQPQRPRNNRKGGKKSGGGYGGGSGSGGNNHHGGGGQQQRGPAPPPAPWICMSPGGQFWNISPGGNTGGGHPWRSQQGILGSAPPQQAHTAFAPLHVSPPPSHNPSPTPSWDQAGLIAALQQMSMQGGSP
jgi:uncharacterized membrane protein YgcG